MTISRKMGFIPCATSAVNVRFTATMPPYMLTLSASYAACQAASMVFPTAAPQGFMCFSATQKG